MATFILTIFLVLLCVIYIKLKRIYTYWERKGVKGPKPHFIIGNYKSIVQKKDSLASLCAKIYNQYPDEAYVGIYHGLKPTLLIRDPKLIKTIIISNFSSFMDRGYKITRDPLMNNLFAEDGDNWRILRKTLTPLFTSSKLKLMMPLLNNCAKDFMNYTSKSADMNRSEEIRDLCNKYTMKCITSCVLGVDADTFSDEGNIFVDIGRKMFGSHFRTAFIHLLDSIIPGFPMFLRYHLIKKEVTEFFFNLVRTIVKERENNVTKRNDLMDILIDMKKSGSITSKGDFDTELEITDEIMAAQTGVFFAAGYETSSASMSFLLYELALNPSIQNTCYEEIKRVMDKYKGELTYESYYKEFEYLSMTFSEAMRKHVIGGYLLRQCVNDYKVPNSSLIIEKGIKIIIPVFGIQKDPKYYPDPEKFDPERFAENGKNIYDCTSLTFGDGPRNCIGMRLAKLQSMVGIVHFLHSFRVEPSERTPEQITYDPTTLTITSKDGVWLNIVRR